MKRLFLLSLFFLVFTFVKTGLAQLISVDPFFPTVNDAVTIYYDASQGSGGLKNCNCDVYIHTGVITTQSTGSGDWKHVVTTWGQANPLWKMTPVAGRPNVFSFRISPRIRSFYSILPTETVKDLAFVFRNATGTLEGKTSTGSDILYPVSPDNVDFQLILLSPNVRSFTATTGQTFPVSAASSQPANWTLLENGVSISTASGKSFNATVQAKAPGTQEYVLQAVSTSTGKSDSLTFNFAIPLNLPRQDPPPGTEPGITLLGNQNLRLALYAPGKSDIFVIGDFSDWKPKNDFQLRTSLDGNLHWIEFLAPAETFRFQYLVDNTTLFGDPYSTLVLDTRDGGIPATNYPDLIPYPTRETSGYVTVVKPNETPYQWQVSDFDRPDKDKLVIYELLIRDFLKENNYQTLLDTLPYLKRLGINAIQLMPVNEFEDNNSWGYNPSYHMALDKYYGSKEAFQKFIDKCHQEGIAVILDVVYNHAYRQSPFAQLYWDLANNRPSADNPWLNPVAKHEFNVGNDFNHESAATKFFVKKVLKYWLTEFNIDGFRFDLSKGFTQKNTLGNATAMAAYDASRIAILKDYANTIWALEPDAYVIMEHFADNTEETELINSGMMVWSNLNGAFRDAAKGASSNLSWMDYKTRGWTVPAAVNYMESHDEERMMYTSLQSGNSSPDGRYDIKKLATALRRQELSSVIFYSMPGPKMLWQFGELGFDYSINTCENLTVNNSCRLSRKPVRWDYFQNQDRRRLYDITRSLLYLRRDYEVFHTKNYIASLSDSYDKRIVLRGNNMNVVALGNFQVVSRSQTLIFPAQGWWYDYFTGDSVRIASGPVTISLQPGEYKLLTSRKLPPPPMGYLTSTGTEEVLVNAFQTELVPNPTTGAFTLTFELPKSGLVTAELMDTHGRRVAFLFQERFPSGKQQLPAQVQVPPGLYLLKIKSEGVAEVKKILIQ
jgi:glycosidase